MARLGMCVWGARTGMALLSSLLRRSFVSAVSFVAACRSSLVCACMGFGIRGLGVLFFLVLLSREGGVLSEATGLARVVT